MTKPAAAPEPALSPKPLFNLTPIYGSKHQVTNVTRKRYLELHNKALTYLHLSSLVCLPGLAGFLLPPFFTYRNKGGTVDGAIYGKKIFFKFHMRRNPPTIRY